VEKKKDKIRTPILATNLEMVPEFVKAYKHGKVKHMLSDMPLFYA
jgi:hypothetical protein